MWTLPKVLDKLFKNEHMPSSAAEEPKTTATSESFEEFKAVKRAPSSQDVKPAQPSEPIETPSVPKADKPEGESARASEAPIQEDSGKKQRSNSESRIRELLAERDEWKRKAESAAPAPIPVAPKPEEPRPVEPPKPAAEDPRPRREQYLKDAYQKYPNETYEQLLDRFDDHLGEWQERQSERKEQEKIATESRKTWQTLFNEARAKNPDFDAKVLHNAPFMEGMTREAKSFLDNLKGTGLEIAYRVGSDPALTAKIAAMPWAEQVSELADIRKSLQNPTEKPQPTQQQIRPVLVSRAPAPPRVLGGVAPADSTAPSNMDEFRAAKRAGRI